MEVKGLNSKRLAARLDFIWHSDPPGATGDTFIGGWLIYHFCDSGFGQLFHERAQEYARSSGVTITTVTSRRRRVKGHRGLVARFRAAMRAIAGEQRSAEPIDGLPRLLVADINGPEFAELVKPGDVGIVTGFNQIFRAATIARFASLVNIHASVLPLYRGPTPTYWCIANDEKTTGFTLHEVTPIIDAGPVLYQATVPIDGITDENELATRIAAAASDTFIRYLERIRTGEPWEVRSVDAHAVYRTPVDYESFPP